MERGNPCTFLGITQLESATEGFLGKQFEVVQSFWCGKRGGYVGKVRVFSIIVDSQHIEVTDIVVKGATAKYVQQILICFSA